MIRKESFVKLYPPFSFGKAYPLLGFPQDIINVRDLTYLRNLLIETTSWFHFSKKEDDFSIELREIVNESIEDVKKLRKILSTGDINDLSFKCCIAKVIRLLPFGNYKVIINSKNLLKIHKSSALRQILKGFISLLMLFYSDWNDNLREILGWVKENYKFFKKEKRELLR